MLPKYVEGYMHNDTITDLPITLQRELTRVTDIVTASIRSRKTYRVRVQRVVLVCALWYLKN